MTDKERIEVNSLVNQAKEGKQIAFTKLYNKYKGLIRYVINDILKNADATDDVLSQTFTKAFMKIDSYTDDISFEMWLKTIAINSSIDYIRRTKYEQSNYFIDDDECFLQLGSLYESPEDTLIGDETARRLEDAYSRLRIKYRNILDMKINKDLTYKQIGEELCLSELQVKSMLNKARKRLKQLYEKTN